MKHLHRLHRSDQRYYRGVQSSSQRKGTHQGAYRGKGKDSKEKISSLHKLAMGVAHEIRNPMVTIGGFAARILRDSRSSEDTRRYAQSILEDARKLEKVVDKIQQYCNLPGVELAEGDPAKALAERFQRRDITEKREASI